MMYTTWQDLCAMYHLVSGPPPPPLAILTGVWSPSILSTDILSVHRVICPTTESPSMKYPYPRQPTPTLSGNPVSASANWGVDQSSN